GAPEPDDPDRGVLDADAHRPRAGRRAHDGHHQPRHHLVRTLRAARGGGARTGEQPQRQERRRGRPGPLLPRRHLAPDLHVDAVPRHARAHPAAMIRAGLAAVGLVVTAATLSWAHAFPDHAEPRVGATLDASPSDVRIWFDGEIEPVFSTIRVENG